MTVGDNPVRGDLIPVRGLLNPEPVEIQQIREVEPRNITDRWGILFDVITTRRRGFTSKSMHQRSVIFLGCTSRICWISTGAGLSRLWTGMRSPRTGS